MSDKIHHMEIEQFRNDSYKWCGDRGAFTDDQIIQILRNSKAKIKATRKYFDSTGMNAETYYNFLHQNGYREDSRLSVDGGFEIFELYLHNQLLEHIEMVNPITMGNTDLN